jgi:hypothetical protein
MSWLEKYITKRLLDEMRFGETKSRIRGDYLQGNGLNGKFIYTRVRIIWTSKQYGKINIWHN